MEHKCQQCPYLAYYVQCTRICHERQNQVEQQKREDLKRILARNSRPCITRKTTTVTEDYQVGQQRKGRQVLVKTTRPAPSIILEEITVIEDYRPPRR